MNEPATNAASSTGNFASRMGSAKYLKISGSMSIGVSFGYACSTAIIIHPK
jgi:hypothetical protein